MAKTNRDAYLPHLARGLCGAAQHGCSISLTPNYQKALSLIEESVSPYLGMVEHEPEAFNTDLRSALGTQADVF